MKIEKKMGYDEYYKKLYGKELGLNVSFEG
jgi:hypothetical protein